MKVKCMRWIVFIVIMAVTFCILYLACFRHFRTNLAIDIDSVERIEYIVYWADGEPRITPLEISPWVDFFNSLELTYRKDGKESDIMYSRPGTRFAIYYTDGTTDTIRFHFGHLIYNGHFYDIDNPDGKTEIHDKLLGFGHDSH